MRIAIAPDSLDKLKNECLNMRFPLIEEYDFKRDTKNPDLDIELKPNTMTRDYQEQALAKMFSNERARSGIIVLPCGAGKTLTGITAACTIKKSILVVCTSQVSAEQWKREFLKWSLIKSNNVKIFTSSTTKLKENDDFFQSLNRSKAMVLICTYSMLSYSGDRAEKTQMVMDFVHAHEWGLMLLDEVQVVPAQNFRLITEIQAHCKLGLTATLVREDGKIDDLHFLIGPKLYEANWIDLQERGYLARAQCIEVWCEMTPRFYTEYFEKKGFHMR